MGIRGAGSPRTEKDWSQISVDPKAYENRHIALLDDEQVKESFMAEVGSLSRRLT